MNRSDYMAPPEISRMAKQALVAGILVILACVIAGVANPVQFFRSYLIGFLLWTGVAVGCLALVMLQHVSGGAWGFVIRRPLESGTRTIPLILLFFIPLLWGVHRLYPWDAPGAVTGHQAIYLNLHSFALRAVLYFAVWLVLAFFLNRWSLEQDGAPTQKIKRHLILLSGPGIALYALTMSFAAVDWIMSLQPHWASSIFGFIVIAGQALGAMSFVITVVALLAQREPLAGLLQPRHFHDLGKLLLAFTMFWAYVTFSQLIIIWAGNLPEEIPWYMTRLRSNWLGVSIVLLLFHFAIPFVLLLSRDLKRNPRRLALVALGLLVMRWVDLFWLTAPSFSPTFSFHWMDLLLPIGMGGIWMAAFFWQLQGRPLLAVGDSFLPKALEHAEE
jgi:hypothetical protein